LWKVSVLSACQHHLRTLRRAMIGLSCGAHSESSSSASARLSHTSDAFSNLDLEQAKRVVLTVPTERVISRTSPALPLCPELPLLNNAFSPAAHPQVGLAEDKVIAEGNVSAEAVEKTVLLEWRQCRDELDETEPARVNSSLMEETSKLISELRADIATEVLRTKPRCSDKSDPEVTHVESRINDCLGQLEARLHLSADDQRRCRAHANVTVAYARDRHNSFASTASPSGSSNSSGQPPRPDDRSMSSPCESLHRESPLAHAKRPARLDASSWSASGSGSDTPTAHGASPGLASGPLASSWRGSRETVEGLRNPPRLGHADNVSMCPVLSEARTRDAVGRAEYVTRSFPEETRPELRRRPRPLEAPRGDSRRQDGGECSRASSDVASSTGSGRNHSQATGIHCSASSSFSDARQDVRSQSTSSATSSDSSDGGRAIPRVGNGRVRSGETLRSRSCPDHRSNIWRQRHAATKSSGARSKLLDTIVAWPKEGGIRSYSRGRMPASDSPTITVASQVANLAGVASFTSAADAGAGLPLRRSQSSSTTFAAAATPSRAGVAGLNMSPGVTKAAAQCSRVKESRSGNATPTWLSSLEHTLGSFESHLRSTEPERPTWRR